MNLKLFLQKKFNNSLKKILKKNFFPKNFYPKLLIKRNSAKTKISYQVNGIIPIAHLIKANPIYLAKKIIQNLELEKKKIHLKISHPGFINIKIKLLLINSCIKKMIYSKRLGIKNLSNPKKIIIDYSSPNAAKEMHVGHLRSTIIGDSTANLLEFLGNKVIRINHLGDLGFQFGLIITWLKEKRKENKNFSIKNYEKFYQKAKQKCKLNKVFLKKSQKCLLKLQKKNHKYEEIRKKIVKKTISKNKKIYNLLNISLKKKNIIGESFYSFMLKDIVKDLKKKKIAQKDKGEIVIFLKNFKNKKNKPMGVIIQKKNGLFLYSTTEIACLKYRYEKFKINKIIYSIDSRQKQHLQQVWKIAKKAKYIPSNFSLEHQEFGMILKKNKKPFKTRDGKTVKLYPLLKKAIQKAKKMIRKKNFNLSKKEIKKNAYIIGIGSIKYADLSRNRKKNYIFNWKKMLTFEGNTIPYIEYNYARILSILKKISILKILRQNKKFFLPKKSIEIRLSIKILQFEEIIKEAAETGMPNILCTYLYELTIIFSKFYEKKTILHFKNKITLYRRITLLMLTGRIIKKGLFLLGIKTVKKM